MVAIGLYRIHNIDLADPGLAPKHGDAAEIVLRQLLLRPGLQPADGEDMKLQGLRSEKLDGCCIRPELFKIVEAPHLGLEDMDDDIARINQHPVALGNAFNPDVFPALLLQLVDELVGDGVDMAVGAAGDHDHVIGDRTLAFEANSDDLFGLGIFKLADDGLEQRLVRLAPGRCGFAGGGLFLGRGSLGGGGQRIRSFLLRRLPSGRG